MSVEVIAIDGPAGAGKSTVAKAIAKTLGFQYLDTGAMYRALALKIHKLGIDQNDKANVIEIAKKIDIHFEPGTPQRVILDSEDVTLDIRTQEISEIASVISALPEVRHELVRRQKQMASKGRVVLEGRDTTTVVCPEARLKVFLTASIEERARRRWNELIAKNEQAPTLDEVKNQIIKRDERDSTRENSPLKIAEDALVIDTDNLSPDEVIEKILYAWHNTSKIASLTE
jgi:cytidylate kinase